MKELIRPEIKYPQLLIRLLATVYGIDADKIQMSGRWMVKITDRKFLPSDKRSSVYHWLEVAYMLLNELNVRDEDVEEFSHCVMLAFNDKYDPESTLYPEQYLLQLYNRLPNAIKVEEEANEDGKEEDLELATIK